MGRHQQKEATRRRVQGATLDELARSYDVGIVHHPAAWRQAHMSGKLGAPNNGQLVCTPIWRVWPSNAQKVGTAIRADVRR